MLSGTKTILGTDTGTESYWATYINDGAWGTSIATDPSGNAYALVNYTCQVVQFDVTGNLTDQYGLDGADGYSAVHDGTDLHVSGYTGSTMASYSRFSSGTLEEAEDVTISSGTTNDAYNIALRDDATVLAFLSKATVSSVQCAAVWVTGVTGGNATWARKLAPNTAGNCLPGGVAFDSSNNVYVAIVVPNGTYKASVLAKYNSSGTLQWQRELRHASNSVQVVGLVIDSSDNIYISMEYGGTDLAFAKYNSSGTIQWQRELSADGDINDVFNYYNGVNYMTIDDTDNIYLCLGAEDAVAVKQGALIVKYNSSGTIQWQRLLYGGDGTYGNAMGCSWVNDALYVYFYIYINPSYYSVVARLPDDGSLTGTHGIYTYAVADLTDAAGSLTDDAGDMTDSSATVTSSADASSQSDPSYTDTTQAFN